MFISSMPSIIYGLTFLNPEMVTIPCVMSNFQQHHYKLSSPILTSDMDLNLTAIKKLHLSHRLQLKFTLAMIASNGTQVHPDSLSGR